MFFTRIILQRFLSVLLFTGNLQAQEAIVASGGDISGSEGSVNYSFGQVIYIFNTGENGTEAQGVQQPYVISVAKHIESTNFLKHLKTSNLDSSFRVATVIEDDKYINLKCIAYPNPTINFLTLAIDFIDIEKGDFSYRLFDINGKLLLSSKVENNNTRISMSNLISGIYYLNIKQGNKEIKSFKIVKSQNN